MRARDAAPPSAASRDRAATGTSTRVTGRCLENLRLADTAEHPPWPVAAAGWILHWSLAQVVGLVNGLHAMTGIAWARPTAPVQAVVSITGRTWDITAASVIWNP
jgi:hypothetical protein